MSTRRTRRPQLIDGRMPGERPNNGGPIHPLAGHTYGELRGALWYRLRETLARRDGRGLVLDGRCWSVSVELLGERHHALAVVDDFGDLVRVKR